MAEVILHIGTHKTGTTSFQHWLQRSSDRLASAGVTVHEGLLGESHAEFALLAMRADRGMPIKSLFPDWCLTSWQHEARAAIAERMERPDPRVIVSAEALSYLRADDEMQRLAQLCGSREIRVILVRRNPSAFLASYRSTLARLGFEPSRYPESFAYVEDDSWLVDYDAVIAAYRRIADSSQIHVIDYEDALDEHGSIIPAIAAAADIDIDRIPVDGIWDNARGDGGGSGPAKTRIRAIGRRWLPPALAPVASRVAGATRRGTGSGHPGGN